VSHRPSWHLWEFPNFTLSGFLKLVVQVPATHRLSTGQQDILEHETTKYTPNDLLLLFIKDLLVMGNQYFWWASKI
jgi:hypothetical protein